MSDAWDIISDSVNGIEGQHLKCAKGRWLLDDNEIITGDDGLRICVVMETATVGEVLWQDHKIAERNIGRVQDGFQFPDVLTDGWNPYVAVMAVRADAGHVGDLLTFTSSSWGGRRAFQSLVNPYRIMGKRRFPICTLGTKTRNDENRNIDPTFRIVGWSNRGNFAELVPVEQPPAAIAAPPKTAAELIGDYIPTAELIDDEIPF